MVSISLSFCDLCKEPSRDQLHHGITLTSNGGEPNGGEICNKCYQALTYKLAQEINPVLPKAATEGTQSEKNSPEPVPQTQESTDELLEEEITVVKSKFDRANAEKIRREQGCQHKSGFSFETDGIVCKDCKQKVNF